MSLFGSKKLMRSPKDSEIFFGEEMKPYVAFPMGSEEEETPTAETPVPPAASPANPKRKKAPFWRRIAAIFH
jgi:hypothetical protein